MFRLKEQFIPLVFLLAPFWDSSLALLPTICWCMQRRKNTIYTASVALIEKPVNWFANENHHNFWFLHFFGVP